jgi:4-hydroxy-tetrahydrodipicolinate reductase
MKLALLGKGKTGSKVLELHEGEVTVFDSQNRPTLETLREHDMLISFLPGDTFLEYLPLFLESSCPMVIGSTGFTWPVELDATLKNKKMTWIYGSNFSLGVVLTKILIEKMNDYLHLFDDLSFTLHEVHHTKKLDAPSGTALSMASWVDGEVSISSERTGDVIGFHALTMKTAREEITLSHNALDRSLFAQGALKAAEIILQNKLPAGLHNFQEVIQKQMS